MAVRRVALLGAIVLVLSGCGASKESEPTGDLLGQNTASGKHASATASADVGSHVDFTVDVNAVPNQRITGGWVISCRVGTASSRDADNFGGRTPLVVHTRPHGGSSEGCTVVALARRWRSRDG
jgi:hypothetical protein